MTDETLRKKLRKKMHLRKHTQKDVAKKCGLNQSTISSVLTAKHSPDFLTKAQLEEFYLKDLPDRGWSG